MRFSIVTPVYNGEKYIAKTIESVLSQEGDFEIEYIIMDGVSTDRTIGIIKSYNEKINGGNYQIKCRGITLNFLSEKDNGMYDAINKGFSKATGDICAYINSDDTYVKGAFSVIEKAFKTFPDIEWLKGITSFIDENGKISKGSSYIYNQKWIEMGIYGKNAYFIHQDSVFWRSSLWQKAGPIALNLRYAGDYSLWISFAKYANLWSINREVSQFRSHEEQLSSNMAKYRAEQKLIKNPAGFLQKKVKVFFWLQSKISKDSFPPFFHFLYRFLFPDRNKKYIEITEENALEIREAKSYIILK